MNHLIFVKSTNRASARTHMSLKRSRTTQSREPTTSWSSSSLGWSIRVAPIYRATLTCYNWQRAIIVFSLSSPRPILPRAHIIMQVKRCVSDGARFSLWHFHVPRGGFQTWRVQSRDFSLETRGWRAGLGLFWIEIEMCSNIEFIRRADDSRLNFCICLLHYRLKRIQVSQWINFLISNYNSTLIFPDFAVNEIVVKSEKFTNKRVESCLLII